MKNSIKVLIGIGLAGLFLWLTMREIEFDKVLDASKEMSFLWIIPFVFTVLTGHLSRALRWRLLINNGNQKPSKTTVFTGVMFGYLTNILFARLGEVTRPVYVAKQIGESNSKLIGTVVLERIIDTLCLLLIMALVFIFLISDPDVLHNLFGLDFTNSSVIWFFVWKAIKLGGILLAVIVSGYFLLKVLSNKTEIAKKIYLRLRGVTRTFIDGILAIRELENWPLFLLYTVLIWSCYILMVYIPFWMFDMHSVYELSMSDAVVLTMVSAVGIIIPTPGGIGTYHLFITKSLLLLYAVPETIGFAYATITHAATLIIIIVVTPVLLAADKYVNLKKQRLKVVHERE